MPNNYLSVLYKHIIKVENKNVGLKVCVCVWGGGGGGTNIPLPTNQKSGGHMPPLPPPPTSYANDTYIHAYIYIYNITFAFRNKTNKILSITFIFICMITDIKVTIVRSQCSTELKLFNGIMVRSTIHYHLLKQT